MTKKYFLSRHGCAKNQVDAEIMVGVLNQKGWNETEVPDDASLIIINSCGFIEPAKKEAIDAVLTARENHPNAKILLAGCLAQRYADLLATELDEADGFFGNGDILKIGDAVDELFWEPEFIPSDKELTFLRNKKKPVWLFPQEGVSCGARPKLFNFPRSVYIKITEGCNHFCTFCAIPIIRGRLRSRKISDIVAEIESFIKQGYYEFNLIGQDLAAFQQENTKSSQLANLLFSISELEGDFRIRLLYIHPDNFPFDILDIMAKDKRFLPYFDLPFQSASEKILKAMNRKGSPKKYLELIKKISSAFEKTEYSFVSIRTTFLTGFPGETNIDFEITLKFLQDARTLWSGGFVFSAEDDTPAAKMKNNVKKSIAEKRKNLLQDEQTKITTGLLENMVGNSFKVLVEEIIPPDEADRSFAIGRAWFQAPEVDGAVVVVYEPWQTDIAGQSIKPGSIVNAKIEAVRGVDLEASAV
ncbi:MAG: 30S ribosomal protein S12 methylthiotransferase RimO [Treponema sp.]|nr:MAG: 30S ribosomal protein S12 methylthiotransferase RimO [Treponema sp.]